MQRIALTLMSLSLLASACSHASQTRSEASSHMLSVNDIRMVAPALDKYREDRLLGEVWKRPGLAPRDRSIVTLAALIARTQTIEMPYHLNLALDNGVQPREVSEIITHLAFYSGWPNAMSAVAVARDVFAQRKIGTEQLPPGRRHLRIGRLKRRSLPVVGEYRPLVSPHSFHSPKPPGMTIASGAMHAAGSQLNIFGPGPHPFQRSRTSEHSVLGGKRGSGHAGELAEFARAGPAGYKVPRWIEFVADLPNTAGIEDATGRRRAHRLECGTSLGPSPSFAPAAEA